MLSGGLIYTAGRHHPHIADGAITMPLTSRPSLIRYLLRDIILSSWASLNSLSLIKTSTKGLSMSLSWRKKLEVAIVVSDKGC